MELDAMFKEIFFDQKLALEISVIKKWWQNLKLLHYFPEYLAPMSYVDPGSGFIWKYKFGIGFENVGKFRVKSPNVS